MKILKLKQYLSSTKIRNYVILVLSIVFLGIIAILAEFGDDHYEWTREEDGVAVEKIMNTEITNSSILNILKNVKDPEIEINIVDLGLIVSTETEGEEIIINMILTTPYCPYSSTIIDNIRKELFKYDKINRVELTVKSEPAWTFDRLTEDGKLAVKQFFERANKNEHKH